MNEELFNAISKWQKETFGQATPLSKIAHLAKELEELVEALKTQDPNTDIEFADCFFLLYGAAASHGMSYKDITRAITIKFKINQNRKWGKPDENGVVEHIKENSDK